MVTDIFQFVAKDLWGQALSAGAKSAEVGCVHETQVPAYG